MKEINTNYWAHYNEEWSPYSEWATPVPITDLPTLAIYYSFYVYSAGGPANFYYRLAGSLIYSILGEDDYFDEED